MKRMKKEWTLRELAADTGVPERTIRFYISRGLVDPPLRGGRGAAYGAGHKARLEDIKKLQAKGMMLAEISHAIALANSEPVHRGKVVVLDEALPERRQARAAEADAELRLSHAAAPGYAPARVSAPAPSLPEPAVWRSYPVAPDVMVMVRAEAGPWRTKRILSALRQFSALVAPESMDREPRETGETGESRDDGNKQVKSIKGNKNDKDDKENQGE
jgi:DNA-binding transcriptional MerR regulator